MDTPEKKKKSPRKNTYPLIRLGLWILAFVVVVIHINLSKEASNYHPNCKIMENEVVYYLTMIRDCAKVDYAGRFLGVIIACIVVIIAMIAFRLYLGIGLVFLTMGCAGWTCASVAFMDTSTITHFATAKFDERVFHLDVNNRDFILDYTLSDLWLFECDLKSEQCTGKMMPWEEKMRYNPLYKPTLKIDAVTNQLRVYEGDEILFTLDAHQMTVPQSLPK